MTSAIRASAAAKFFLSDRTATCVESMLEPVFSDAPTCATSSASWSASRVFVPSSSIAAVKLARPGSSSGFASLPVRNTRLADTTGRPGRGLRSTVRPLASVKRCGSAIARACAGPGVGCVLRHGSSALTASAPVPAATFGAGGVGTCGPRSGWPGSP